MEISPLLLKLKGKLQDLSSDRFIRNLGWMGIAELLNRISRLATTLVLARTFTAYDYGLASIIFTIFDFGIVLTVRSGISAKIMQCDESELASVCNTSYWLNWTICGLLFIAQCIAAYPIAYFYHNNQLILPICTIALSYLTLPLYTIQASLIQRENRLKITGISAAMQCIAGNIMTMILAVNGWGVWAVALPIVLTMPIIVIFILMQHSWQPPKFFKLAKWKEITNFSMKMLGVEILGRIRMNLDYLLIGRFVGIEALGLYFFAFNAGLGISQSVFNAFSVALLPHLCAVREDNKLLKKQFFSSLKTLALIVIPLVFLQSSLAPFYVPIVFGQKWVEAIPILIIICLSAIPISLSRATSGLLQAVDKTHIDLYWNLIFTGIFALSLAIAVQHGIFAVAWAVLISQAVAMPIFTIWAVRYLFRIRDRIRL